ncbi:MalY/PatB family protein [Streptomyces antnestii]|nr:aminotransferase class I/II-fold pyridoxal phosphate-dependent enzyme [Streptomyces sp. San01]
MDFGTAPVVQEALHEAVREHLLGYLPQALTDSVRRACADWQQDTYGWSVDADDVQLLPDVVRALHVAIQYFSKPATPVIVPTPAYPPFLKVPAVLGRPVIEVDMVNIKGRFTYDLEELDRAFRAGGHILLLCNPHNPTGRVLDRTELAALSEVVERHGGRVFADEVHAPLTYPGQQHIPYASISPAAAAHTITATSASKAWNLPGLKCAQVLLSNDADRNRWQRLDRLATDGTSVLGAVANAAAFRHGRPWLEQTIGLLDRNRHRLGCQLKQAHPCISYVPPEGTYLAWLDCRSLALDRTPARYFADRGQISTLDGGDCGRAGKGFVRLNFATDLDVLTRIVHRIAASLAPCRIS